MADTILLTQWLFSHPTTIKDTKILLPTTIKDIQGNLRYIFNDVSNVQVVVGKIQDRFKT